MTDYERPAAPIHYHERDLGASVRMIIQALILAGILWLARSVSEQSASIVGMQVQLADLKATLDDVPGMKDRITLLEARADDLTRRQNADDARREHMNNALNKEWTK